MLILIEPHTSVREALCTLLVGEGWEVLALESADQLEAALRKQDTRAVISEARLPGFDANAVLKTCKEQGIPLVFTGHEQAVQEAVDLIQKGASGFLEKPFSQDRLLKLLRQLPDRHNKKASMHHTESTHPGGKRERN
jgi:DNA-binding NtrC family response regulator